MDKSRNPPTKSKTSPQDHVVIIFYGQRHQISCQSKAETITVFRHVRKITKIVSNIKLIKCVVGTMTDVKVCSWYDDGC
jgi:hypothetical protein